LQCLDETIINSVEEIDVDFLESVGTTELIDLVMDLVKNPHSVVVNGVVLNRLIDVFASQTIDNFDTIKPNEHTTTRSTRN
jgi:hypothetical protein